MTAESVFQPEHGEGVGEFREMVEAHKQTEGFPH
jgi:hypothetical protein